MVLSAFFAKVVKQNSTMCGGLTEVATSIDHVVGGTYTLMITVGTNSKCSVSCSIEGKASTHQGELTSSTSFTSYPNNAESFNEKEYFGSSGKQNQGQFMNVITFKSLTQYSNYLYTCFLDKAEAVSAPFTFPNQRGSVRVVAVGDWDWQVGNVTAKYVEDNADDYDAVVAMGDYAYDLCNFGNSYMENMMGVTAVLPFMVTAGNHEGNSHCADKNKKTDFIDYINRFNMPHKETSHNLYFSYDIGNVHFASITTELFLMGSKNSNATKLTAAPLEPEFGTSEALLHDMLEWLKEDLSNTTKKWKVIYFHRPYYTNYWVPKKGPSNKDKNQMAAAVIRPLLEPIVLKHKVDLVLTGDVHGSERLQPMRNGKVVGDHEHHGHRRYHNVGAPIYLVCGNAGEKGNPEGVKYPPKNKEIWKDASVWTNTKNHGFCDITFTEDSISYSYVNTDKTDSYEPGDILDSFVLTKKHHRLR